MDTLWGIIDFFGRVALAWFWSSAPESAGGPAIPTPHVPQPGGSDAARAFADYMVHGWPVDFVFNFWGALYPIVIFLGLCIGVVILYCMIRVSQIRNAEDRAYRAGAHPVLSKDESRVKLRWTRISEQAASEDEHQWRLAILEADIMLNDLLDSLGYRGETMADKMKQVRREQFNTIDLAWEAHKARNQIAHEGAKYTLTSREARRILRMYEQVFREFDFLE